MNLSNKMNKNSSTLSREAATLSSLLLRVPTLVDPPGLSAKMKVSYVFSLQEKSITLRLFTNKLCAGRCQLAPFLTSTLTSTITRLRTLILTSLSGLKKLRI